MCDGKNDGTATEVTVSSILYQDCSSYGEVADVHRESDACYYCALSPVCLVAHAKRTLDDAFVAVSRCRAFVDRVVEGEEFVVERTPPGESE